MVFIRNSSSNGALFKLQADSKLEGHDALYKQARKCYQKFLETTNFHHTWAIDDVKIQGIFPSIMSQLLTSTVTRIEKKRMASMVL